MSIRRRAMHWDNDFTIIPNNWARDERLSRKARGLLLELASHRPGWEVTVASLVDTGTEGIDAVRGAIKELTTYGYLTVERARGDAGRLAGVDYLLSDPWTEVAVSPTSDEPILAEPILAEPQTKKTIPQEEYLEENDGGLFEAYTPPPAKVSRIAVPLPDNFTVTEEMLTWARDKAPVVWGRQSLVMETEKFKAYHQSKGTRFKDWTAAWRNWMMNAEGYAQRDMAAAGRVTAPAQPAGDKGYKLGLDYGGLGEWK